MRIYTDGRALFTLNAALSILVAQGREVTVAATSGVSPGEIMTFLLGAALGLLCHQRRILPLHAAALQIGEAAVALVGEPGSGKSTTATALMQRGHSLLCDDILVLNARQARLATPEAHASGRSNR
ncbi:hypothetical protein [Pseudomonas sp. LRF_L74]|uniref:hypothetical protein n=1 Tax=Pseudomonas sp. LRF_L74 TaxID=3369422 RepID=UPI003F5EAB21